MTTNDVPRGSTSRIGWALLVCLCATLFAASAAAAQSGGFVPASPVPATQETEVIDILPTSTPGSDNEGALAPGFVTVFFWTSDGNVAPTGASLCVGSLCQPVGGTRHGTKIEFDRVPSGWQAVSAYNVAPYRDFSSSVLVEEGAGSRVDVTLVMAVEQRPREQAEQLPGQDRPSRQSDAPARTFGDADLTNGEIRAMPNTGTGASPAAAFSWLAMALVSLGLLTLGVRHRLSGRN